MSLSGIPNMVRARQVTIQLMLVTRGNIVTSAQFGAHGFQPQLWRMCASQFIGLGFLEFRVSAGFRLQTCDGRRVIDWALSFPLFTILDPCNVCNIMLW